MVMVYVVLWWMVLYLNLTPSVNLGDYEHQKLPSFLLSTCYLSMQAVFIRKAFVLQRKRTKEPNGNSKKRNTKCWNCKTGHSAVSAVNQRKRNSSTSIEQN
ncbi:hypothetical protein T4E_5514 [Trichinella pseudospiralis]|uniref:Uncharacterized protein n=1 Tax=Trichinella pseudospiralis TaxID=6337 RepID=A0A0V0YNL8_TRIPS|nr:hypothetical protein T4E_5514 [Trichinella pseudospiralis]